ncbi:autophagy-related 16 [Rhodnius prolixus]
MEGSSSENWRDSIINQIQNRNRQQFTAFQDLIAAHNRLFENYNVLRLENMQISVQNEKLRNERMSIDLTNMTGGISGSNAKITLLESRLLAQQEELTELHKKKGENAQMVVDLNKKLQEKELVLRTVEESLNKSITMNSNLKAEVQRYVVCKTELENLNQLIRDEHQALQLAYSHLEEKLRKAQDENRQLVDKLMKYKSKDAEKLNEENDTFNRLRAIRMQRELEEAAKDTRGIPPDLMPPDCSPILEKSTVPARPIIVFDAHEGEISAVKWSPVDQVLATGGQDRKVKLWDISKGTAESRGLLVGSNAGVMSVSFDTCGGTFILGASNDFATRVWGVNDQRLKHTLTGHCGKVLAAKFLNEMTRVVTGSHDRTLKVWDLRSRACVETKFAGSSCNDVVNSDSAGTTIISGHFDKKIRFWDTRTEQNINEIVVQGRVTSLDLSRDAKTLLCCVRDDTLRLVDLRANQILQTYSADGFKVACDWTRAAFSPDGDFVVVGSSEGGIYIFKTSTAQLESVLRQHTCPVIAVSWHPYANYISSVDRGRKAIVWADR